MTRHFIACKRTLVKFCPLIAVVALSVYIIGTYLTESSDRTQILRAYTKHIKPKTDLTLQTSGLDVIDDLKKRIIIKDDMFTRAVVLNMTEKLALNTENKTTFLHNVESKNVIKKQNLKQFNSFKTESNKNKVITTVNVFTRNETLSLTKGRKYIVYFCPANARCQGWGDRQRGILSTYLLSLLTNRTFKVDMQNPCSLGKFYHSDKLNWKIQKNEFIGLSSRHLSVKNNSTFRKHLGSVDFNSLFNEEVVYVTTNYDYYYELRSNPYYKSIFKKTVNNLSLPSLFSHFWRNIFKLNKSVLNRAHTALRESRPTKNYKLVCAHIRFGRNPTIPKDTEVRNTLETINPVLEFLRNYSDPSKYRLFIASDWQDFRDDVRHQFPNMTVEVTGKVMHIDFARGKKESVACDGFEKAIADQYVLSQCDILLLTKSVFGKTAAYLRNTNKDLFQMIDGEIKKIKYF